MTSRVVERGEAPFFPDSIDIKIGVLDADAQHEGDALTVGELAEMHEFGLGVPQRSWLREWFDESEEQLSEIATRYFEQSETEADYIDAADLVTEAAVASCTDRIRDGLTPAITNESTIRSKKSRGFKPPYTPLIETGVLISSIKGEATVK